MHTPIYITLRFTFSGPALKIIHDTAYVRLTGFLRKKLHVGLSAIERFYTITRKCSNHVCPLILTTLDVTNSGTYRWFLKKKQIC
jgi:hypothetical protein